MKFLKVKCFFILLSVLFLSCILVGCGGRSGSGSGYSLTVCIEGNGDVDISPYKSSYNSGDIVTLTALADYNWDFSHWEGSVKSNSSVITITMDSNISLNAVFGEVLLEDNFNNNNNSWTTGTSSNQHAIWDLNGGKYIMTANYENVIMWSSPATLNSYPADYFLGIDFEFHNLNKYGEAGFIFNHKDDNNYYIMAINTNGNYSIYKKDNGSWYNVTQWKNASHININSTNNIAITKRNNRFTFYTNGHYLDDIIINNSFTDVRIMAGSGPDFPVDVFFDNYQILNLSPMSITSSFSSDNDSSGFTYKDIEKITKH